MKRYWLSIALVALIISSIGTFYISANGSSPQFKLIKQLGAEEEAEDISVRGIYFNQGYRHPAVTINSTGSKYADKQSFLERMDPYRWVGEEMKQLIDEHRQFMRGKLAESSFYEDDNELVYVNVDQVNENRSGERKFNFEVSVLDKKQDETSSYATPVPNMGYHYVSVYDVQVFGDEIIVSMYGFNNDDGLEHIRAVIDKRNGNVLDMHVIDFSGFTKTDTNVNKDVVSAYDEWGFTLPSRYGAFYTVEQKAIEVDKVDKLASNRVGFAKKTLNTQVMELISAQVMIYDKQTGQLEEINLPELSSYLNSQLGANSMVLHTVGDILYVRVLDSTGVKVFEYSITDATTTVHEYGSESDVVISTLIKERRLYMLTRDAIDSNEEPSLLIVNLDTDQLVYQGSIKVEGTEQEQKAALQQLELHQITVK